MAERIELEFQHQDGPCPVLYKPDIELAKGLQALLPVRGFLQAGRQSPNVFLDTMFEQRQKQVFLALEVGVDGPLAAIRASGDLFQLGRLVAIAYKNFLRGI